MPEIDLHTHSTASDGTLTPTELVRLAKKQGLKAIALTDHDTIRGLASALQAGKELGLEVIPGCELSVDYPDGIMHILGLWLRPEAEQLDAALRSLQAKRNKRNELMIAKLQDLGLDITYAEVKELAGGGSVGRPHLAQVLMKKGIVPSIQEAFNKYLGPRGSAYVPKQKLTPEEAISLLKKEQATVILAHPFSLNLHLPALEKELVQLKKLGLDGVEVLYSEHTPDQTAAYLYLCQELDLLVSGGSDFHGTIKPHIALGTGKGNLDIPYSLLEKIKTRRQEQGLWV
ncbi:PHP domain-containing protein [Desulfohalobiaceae bacterium Ax17]|uniref:PHP domain-containing protein n=1 Tax=Desulfovulcanus ferrireducens TaxID=2831190 RepID=UPI00207BC6DF|nr:PHP domain-containing protein [Desulfovulcanus ferrireducens]MBT8764496.1 PHP domain-containing protein [Desulfovulcanus ferrireducens]